MKKVRLEDGKEYIPVKERILKLKNDGVDYSLNSSVSYHEAIKRWVAKAKLTIYLPNGNVREFDGHSQQREVGDKMFRNSAMEIAETVARGRALAAYGIGIEENYSSLDEIEKAVNDVNEMMANAPTSEGVDNDLKKSISNPKPDAKDMQKKDPDGESPGDAVRKMVEEFTKEVPEKPQAAIPPPRPAPVKKDEVPEEEVHDKVEKANKDLERIIQGKEYSEAELKRIELLELTVICEQKGIDFTAYPGKNTNKKLRDLILTHQAKSRVIKKEAPTKQSPAVKQPIPAPSPLPMNDENAHGSRHWVSEDDGLGADEPDNDLSDSGNKFGIEVSELSATGKREFITGIKPLYDAMMKCGIEEDHVAIAMNKDGLWSEYKSVENFMRLAPPEKVHKILDMITV